MEQIFLSGVQFVSDNRHWILPLACLGVWVWVFVVVRGVFCPRKRY
jgi:hypothetical protein